MIARIPKLALILGYAIILVGAWYASSISGIAGAPGAKHVVLQQVERVTGRASQDCRALLLDYIYETIRKGVAYEFPTRYGYQIEQDEAIAAYAKRACSKGQMLVAGRLAFQASLVIRNGSGLAPTYPDFAPLEVPQWQASH